MSFFGALLWKPGLSFLRSYFYTFSTFSYLFIPFSTFFIPFHTFLYRFPKIFHTFCTFLYLRPAGRCMNRCMNSAWIFSSRWPYSKRLKTVENSREKKGEKSIHYSCTLSCTWGNKSMHLFMHLGNKNPCTIHAPFHAPFHTPFYAPFQSKSRFFIHTLGLRSLPD